MLESSGEREYACISPDLKQSLSISLLIRMLAVGFLHVLYQFEEVSFYSLFDENFVMNGHWMLSNPFLHLFIWSDNFSSLECWCVMDYINLFLNFESALPSWDKCNQVIVYICYLK